MDLPGLLLVISGPSGAGKGTVCKALVDKNPSVVYSISATTRAPRTGETDGVNYHFLDKEKFMKMVDNNDFIEWAQVYDNYYGTPKKALLDNLAEGKDVILEIDIQGAIQVKRRFPKGVFIFILPPSLKELRNRIVNRGTDSDEVINKRMSCAAGEIKSFRDYDYIVLNDNIDNAVSSIKAIVSAEKHRTSRYSLVEEDGDLNFIIDSYEN